MSAHSVQPFGEIWLTYIQINIYERRALIHILAWEPKVAQVTKITPAVTRTFEF